MLSCWKFYVNFPLLHNLMSRNKTFLILSRISHRSFDLKLDTREKSFICVCFDYDKVLVTMFTEIYFRFYCPPCSNCDGMWNAKRVQVYILHLHRYNLSWLEIQEKRKGGIWGRWQLLVRLQRGHLQHPVPGGGDRGRVRGPGQHAALHELRPHRDGRDGLLHGSVATGQGDDRVVTQFISQKSVQTVEEYPPGEGRNLRKDSSGSGNYQPEKMDKSLDSSRLVFTLK